MLKLDVTTTTGHSATITTVRTIDGLVLVKMHSVWRNIPTPAIVLNQFEGPDAEREADQYATHLKGAILGTCTMVGGQS